MDIHDFLSNIPQEEVDKKNKEHLEENERMFEEFKDAYKKDCCSLCGNKLNYFNENEKCFHWFTMPIGIKKRDFKEYLQEPIGFFNLESYFRWMSTLIVPLKNINDLSDEKSKSKLKEITIKYKNIEWSLNYGQSDLDGHKKSQNANFPHYHIQMLIDNKPFIRFNDFHIPFSEADLFYIQVRNEASDLVDFRHTQGEGMSILENPEYLEEITNIMKVAKNEDTAQFHTSSKIEMPNGKTMSRDMLNKIFKESEETKIPIRKLLTKYYPEAKITTIVTPGKGVPDMKKRSKR